MRKEKRSRKALPRGRLNGDKDQKSKPLTKQKEIERIRDHYDILLPEQSGYIEPDEHEACYQITQKEIVQSVDITSATKHFDLKLNFGPYRINYYRNGRQLLIGGERGHVAALDWITKKLMCEFNVMESVHDICWLHMPTIFAVAQKDWVHIYDEKGIELHCLRKLHKVSKMEFLPYHFLLVTASELGFLSWTDTSYGKLVTQFRPRKVRRITCMTQNPGSGVILTGHSNGTVNMWTPNSQEAAVNMLCHPGSLRDLHVTADGNRMVSLGVDRTFKLWDIRMFKPLQSYLLGSIGECVDISQRDVISIGMGNVVEIFNNCWNNVIEEPYLRHRLDGFVKNVQFSNFEDVLGIGHQKGFTSILVPGSGEPNFDAFESNPFMTTSQRREMEVKMLLDKIHPELISIDPEILGKVNVTELKATIAAKKKLGYVPVPKIKFDVNKKMKSVDKFKLKQRMKDEAFRKQTKLNIIHKKRQKPESSVEDRSTKGEKFRTKETKTNGKRNQSIRTTERHKSKTKDTRGRHKSTIKSTRGIRAVNRYFVRKGLKKKVVKSKVSKKSFSNVLDRFKNKIN